MVSKCPCCRKVVKGISFKCVTCPKQNTWVHPKCGGYSNKQISSTPPDEQQLLRCNKCKVTFSFCPVHWNWVLDEFGLAWWRSSWTTSTGWFLVISWLAGIWLVTSFSQKLDRASFILETTLGLAELILSTIQIFLFYGSHYSLAYYYQQVLSLVGLFSSKSRSIFQLISHDLSDT